MKKTSVTLKNELSSMMSSEASHSNSSSNCSNATSISGKRSSDGQKHVTSTVKGKRTVVKEATSMKFPKSTSPKRKIYTEEQEQIKTAQVATSPTLTVTQIETASGDASASVVCFKNNFYDVPCEELARSLLGKILVRQLDCGYVLKGRIVETECYLGGEDQASHSFRGKMTERNSPMFMKPGTVYVYFTYGMYYCFNISSQGPGAAVLIRAVEPLEGLEAMAELRARGAKNKKKKKTEEGKEGEAMTSKKPFKPHELCNGPSKLCIAMDIDQDSCNKRDLSCWPGLSVQPDPTGAPAPPVVITKRVGIESAGREWADKPLRFYLFGNPAVSKRDRAKEKELMQACAE